MIEVFIVIGIVAVLGVVILTSLSGRRSRTELDNTTRQIGALLREAQSRSVSQSSSTSWGAHFENSTSTAAFYALFAAPYSSGSVVGYYRLPASVRYATSALPQGGSLDITFAQITGLPSTSTSIKLELPSGGSGGGEVVASSTVTISASGLVSF